MSDTESVGQNPIGPTKRQDRILALDAARGLAILGVFCVNVQMMAGPLAGLFDPKAPEGTLDTAAWAFIKIFCEGKFYPLFSMLFGMGFILLIDRVSVRGQSPVPLYLRRIAILLVVGLLHLSLLWYGDILFLYSLCAIPLLFMRKFSARMLFIAAGICLAFTVIAGSVGVFVLQPPTDQQGTQEVADTEQETDQAESGKQEFTIDPDGSPTAQLVTAFKTGAVEDPEIWAELETMAMRDGPYAEAVGVRLLQYSTFLVFFVPFGYGESVLAMFLLGAGIMRARALDNRKFLLIAIALGMVIGLPAAAGIVLIGASGSQQLAMALSPVGYALFPMVSLMYLAGLTLLASSAAKQLPKLLAPVGRMALTNYLLDSLVLAVLMQHWGLALYGRFSKAELLGTVFGVFVLQIAFSHVWLRIFRFGPMEWLWRSLTYLKPQPMLAPRDLSDPTPTH